MKVLTAIGCAALAASTASAQTSVRYDFDLAFQSNSLGQTDPGSPLASVSQLATGTLSVEASTTPFEGIGSTDFQSHPVLATSGQIDGIDLLLDQSGYPSPSFFTGLGISNESPDGSTAPVDIFGVILPSLLAGTGLTSLGINAPSNDLLGTDLWQSTDLPTSIDLGVPGIAKTLVVSGANASGTNGRLVMQITNVEITLIPAPSAAACLVGAGALVMRRRR
ncbi:MAG: hypothetical protein AAFR96_03085 [Planctomycetota bacterium]